MLKYCKFAIYNRQQVVTATTPPNELTGQTYVIFGNAGLGKIVGVNNNSLSRHYDTRDEANKVLAVLLDPEGQQENMNIFKQMWGKLMGIEKPVEAPQEEVKEEVVQEEPPVEEEAVEQIKAEEEALKAVEYYQQKVLRMMLEGEDDPALRFLQNMSQADTVLLSATVCSYATYLTKQGKGEGIRKKLTNRNYGYTEEFFRAACRIHQQKQIAKFTGGNSRGFKQFEEM